MTKTRTQLLALLTGLLLALITSAGWAHDGRNYIRFQATLQAASTLVIPAPSGAPPGGCDVRGEIAAAKLVAVGAGTTSLFGPVIDDQSHCVTPPNSPRFCGWNFTLKNAKGDALVVGRYFGEVAPTVAPPTGKQPTLLILGNVCIVSLRGYRVDTDCNQSRNFAPVTGTTNLETGDATIFIDQLIPLKEPHRSALPAKRRASGGALAE